MPLMLDTPEINSRIAHITEDARKHIVIVCPYLKINDRLCCTIEAADRRGIDIFVVYGKRKLD